MLKLKIYKHFCISFQIVINWNKNKTYESYKKKAVLKRINIRVPWRLKLFFTKNNIGSNIKA